MTGRGEHDAVRDERALCGLELVAVADPSERRDGRGGPHRHPTGPELGHEGVDHLAEPSPHAQEEGPRGCAGGGHGSSAGERPQGAGHAPLTGESLRDLGGHDVEGELIDPARR